MGPEGIDNGKARPKAEAVLLIFSGEPIWRRMPQNWPFDSESTGLGLPFPHSGHSTCQMARHERAFGPLKAGGRRVEWYRYGDSNPGPVAENHVS